MRLPADRDSNQTWLIEPEFAKAFLDAILFPTMAERIVAGNQLHEKRWLREQWLHPGTADIELAFQRAGRRLETGCHNCHN